MYLPLTFAATSLPFEIPPPLARAPKAWRGARSFYTPGTLAAGAQFKDSRGDQFVVRRDAAIVNMSKRWRRHVRGLGKTAVVPRELAELR